MALIPGLPKLPFLLMAVGLGYMAYRMPARPAVAENEGAAAGKDAKTATGAQADNLAGSAADRRSQS